MPLSLFSPCLIFSLSLSLQNILNLISLNNGSFFLAWSWVPRSGSRWWFMSFDRRGSWVTHRDLGFEKKQKWENLIKTWVFHRRSGYRRR